MVFAESFIMGNAFSDFVGRGKQADDAMLALCYNAVADGFVIKLCGYWYSSKDGPNGSSADRRTFKPRILVDGVGWFECIFVEKSFSADKRTLFVECRVRPLPAAYNALPLEEWYSVRRISFEGLLDDREWRNYTSPRLEQ
jgi:hypothetical protein